MFIVVVFPVVWPMCFGLVSRVNEIDGILFTFIFAIAFAQSHKRKGRRKGRKGKREGCQD